MIDYDPSAIHRQMYFWSVFQWCLLLHLKMWKKRLVELCRKMELLHWFQKYMRSYLRWLVTNTMSSLSLVGTWNYSPLSKDSFPACWDPNWSKRWSLNNWEACQEQAEAHNSRDGWKTGPGPEGCQIRGMLCTYAGEDWSLTIFACLYSILFSVKGKTSSICLWKGMSSASAGETVAFSLSRCSRAQGVGSGRKKISLWRLGIV